MKGFFMAKLEVTGNAAIKATTGLDVEDLIVELRAALKESRRTGGSYSVFRRNGSGSEVKIEVHVNGQL
jgi:hypothetical protein